MTPDDRQTFEIHNVAGVQDLTVELLPGVNVLVGPNAAGKTCATDAITRAVGGGAPVSVRDGAEKGIVAGPGGLVLNVGKRVTSTGSPIIELADYGAVSQLIDPSGETVATREKRRFEALLRLVSLTVDEADLLRLSGAMDPDTGEPTDPTDDQAAIVGGVQAKYRDQEELDLAIAAVAVKLATEGQARLYETRASEASGVLDQSRKELAAIAGEAIPTEKPEASELDLEHELDGLVRGHERLSGRAEQATENAATVARLEAEVGSDSFEELSEGHARLEAEHEDKLAAIVRIEKEAQQLSIDIARVRERGRSAKQLAELRGKLAAGPGDAELDAAASAITAKRQEIEFAREWERLDEITRGIAAKELEAEEFTEHAARVRQTARSIGSRVGRLLFEKGIPGLTYDDDQLHVFDGLTGEIGEPVHRLSLGQRTRLALELAAAFAPAKTLPLEPGFWLGLQPSAQKELATLAAERGLFILTERPDDVEGITVEHVGGEEE